MADSLAIGRWQRFRFIDFPASLPFVVAGLRLGAVYSVLGVIVTEMVASYRGLGQQLVAVARRGESDRREVCYGTTPRFLELFGLAGLDELPRVVEAG